MSATYRKLLIAVVCLFAFCFSGATVARTQDDDAQVTKWFASHAIALTSVEDKENLDQFKPLKDVLRGVRVVGLGEETHGTHEFFQLKRRLIEYLVKDAGFTVFGMELSYAASVDINDYVLTGKGDRARLLAKQGTWAWDTQEVSDLIEWLRQYNSTVPAEKKVRFVGFDIHNNNDALTLVADYLTRVAPERLDAFNKVAQTIRSDDSGRRHLEYIVQLSMADRVQNFVTLTELVGFLYVNQTRFTKQTSAAEFAQAFNDATVLAEFADVYRRPRFDQANPFNSSGYIRDLYMAQHIMRTLNAEKPGTRMIVWAHNDHVGKYKGTLGAYLQEAYGPGYYALGLSFNQGAFQARELAKDVTIGALKEFSVGPAQEGSIESYLNRTGIRNFIVDLRNTTKPEAINQWLGKPLRMRSIGLGFSSDKDSYLRVNLQQTFDGLAFIESTTRAHPNPTGIRGAWIIPEKPNTN